MANTQSMHVRVDESVKFEAEGILSDLGMNMSDAVNIFLRQIILQKGLPFEIKLPTSTDTFYSETNQKYLKEAIEKVNSGKAVMIVKTMEELEEMAEDDE